VAIDLREGLRLGDSALRLASTFMLEFSSLAHPSGVMNSSHKAGPLCLVRFG
jgi:hypothetical protein